MLSKSTMFPSVLHCHDRSMLGRRESWDRVVVLLGSTLTVNQK